MQSINELLNKAKELDPREADLLLAYAIGKPVAFIKTNAQESVDEVKAKKFESFVERRLKHEPIAYIMNYQPFCGCDFFVDENVLIPRPETETLVEIVTKDIKREEGGDKKITVVDIGTGSGCIACSIKKRFNRALVIASDCSPASLSVVKYNDRILSTALKIIHSNLFGTEIAQELESLLLKQKNVALYVTANLPYLPYFEAEGMQKDVINYEPKDALFADDEGMALIKKCIQQINEFLPPYSSTRLSWKLYFEIDPEQSKELRAFAKQVFDEAKIEIKKDLCGRDRFLLIG